MLPILNLGPLALPLPGLLVLAAYWIGASLAERRASQHDAKPELIGNLLYYALIAAILSARLGYALRYPAAFIDSPAALSRSTWTCWTCGPALPPRCYLRWSMANAMPWMPGARWMP